jgi:hypothetical protein
MSLEGSCIEEVKTEKYFFWKLGQFVFAKLAFAHPQV